VVSERSKQLFSTENLIHLVVTNSSSQIQIHQIFSKATWFHNISYPFEQSKAVFHMLGMLLAHKNRLTKTILVTSVTCSIYAEKNRRCL